MPRSVCIDGRAMFTIEASSTTINWAIAMTHRALHRIGSRTGADWLTGTSAADTAAT